MVRDLNVATTLNSGLKNVQAHNKEISANESLEEIKVVSRYHTSKNGKFTPIKHKDIDHVVCQPKLDNCSWVGLKSHNKAISASFMNFRVCTLLH